MVKAFPNVHVMSVVQKHLLKPFLGFIFVLFFLSGDYATAQNSSNKGTDFWVGFMNHRNGSSASMFLYITSDSNTTGTVSVPGQTWSQSFTVTANQMTLVQIPNNVAYVSCSDCIQDRGIHVTS